MMLAVDYIILMLAADFMILAVGFMILAADFTLLVAGFKMLNAEFIIVLQSSKRSPMHVPGHPVLIQVVSERRS